MALGSSVKVGKLVVDMGADVSSLKTDMAAAGRAVATEVQNITRLAGQAKAAIVGMATAMGPISFAGMMKGAVDAMDQVDEMSQKLSISSRAFQELTYVAKLNSTQNEALAGGIKKLQNNMQDAITGGKEQAAVFKAMGISVAGTDGQLRSSLTVIADVADVFEGLHDEVTKTALASKLFGSKLGPELVPLLNQGRKGIEGLREEANQLGIIMGEDALKAAADFNDQIDRMSAVSQAAAGQVALTFIPAINDLIERFLAGKKAGMGFWEAISAASGITINRAMGETYGEQLKNIDREIDNLNGSRNPLSIFGSKGIDDDIAKLERERKAVKSLQALRALEGGDGGAYDDARDRSLNGRPVDARAINKALKDSKDTDKVSEYERLTRAIQEKTAVQAAELASEKELTEGQKLHAKVTSDLETGALKLEKTQRQRIFSLIDELITTEKANDAKKDALKIDKEIKEYLSLSAAARAEATAELDAEYAMYGKSSDARAIALIAIKAQTDAEKEIIKLNKIGAGVSQEQAAQIRADAVARAELVQSIEGQRRALGYANQLMEENRRFAAESIVDEMDRAAAILKIEADLWRERIEMAGAGTEAQKRLQEQYSQWYANQLNKPVIDQWHKTIDQVDGDFHEGFRDMLNRPEGQSVWKSFTKSLGTTLKTSLADALYQTFIKKYVVQALISLAGVISGPAIANALTGSAGGAAGGLFQGASLINAGKTLWEGFTGGMASGIGGVISGAGNAFGLSSIAAFGEGMAGMTGTAAMAASAEATAASLGLTVNTAASTAASLGSTMATAMPYLAAAVAVAAILKNGLSSKVVGSGVMGSISGNQFSGNSYEFKKGGWLRGGSNTNPSDLDAGTTAVFNTAIGAVYSNFSNLGKAVGAGEDLLKDYSYSFRLALADFSAEDRPKVIQTELNRISDSMANAFVDAFRTSIDLAAQQANSYYTNTIDGEAGRPTGASGIVSQTRASTPLDPYIDDMIRIFDAQRATLAGVAESEGKLTAFTTGLFGLGDALAENQGFLNRFGEAIDFKKLEGAAATGETVLDTFARLNMIFSVTNVVAATLGKNAQSAFGVVGVASSNARQRLIDLAGSIDALTSGTAFFAQNFLSESERFDIVSQSVTQQLAALGISGVTTREQFKSVVKGLDLTTESGAKLYAALLNLAPEFAQMTDLGTAVAQASKTAREETRTALGEAYRQQYGEIDSLIKRLQDSSKAYRAFSASLLTGSLSNLSPEGKYEELRGQFDRTYSLAKAGDPTAQANLIGIGQQFLEASQGYNGSSMGYTKDVEYVRAAMESAANAADMQVSVAEQQLAMLDRSVAGILEVKGAVLSVRDLLKQYFNQGGTTGPGGGISGGVSSGISSGVPAIDQMAADINAYGAANGGNAYYIIPGINDYASKFSVASDLVGRGAFADVESAFQTAFGMSPEAFRDIEEKFNAGIPVQARAMGGYTPPGLTLVGELGPELVDFDRSSHIYTARQTREMFSGGSSKELAAAVDRQTEIVSDLIRQLVGAVETGQVVSRQDMRGLKQHLAHTVSKVRVAA